MLDVWTDALAIVIASLAVVAVTLAFVLLRPLARRRRRHKRHSHRSKIDLFKQEPGESALSRDA